MPYIIKVLEDKEFDALPYKYVKEALGCADPKAKVAYVRNTHWGEASKAINLLTIQHELDELVAKTSPHEEDGIQYKKGGAARNIVPTVLGTIIGSFTGMPWLGAAIGAASNVGMQQYAQSNHPEQLGEPGQWQSLLTQAGGGALSGYAGSSALSGAMKGVSAAKAAGTNSIWGGVQGALGMTPTATTSTSGSTLTNAFNSSQSGMGSNVIFGGTPYNLSSGGGMLGASNSLLSSAAGGANAMLNVGSSNIATNVMGSLTKPAGISSANIMKSLDNPLVKLGLSGMGIGAMPINAKIPDIGDIVGKWLTADTVTKAGAVAKNIADTKYTGDFVPSKEIQAYIEVMGKDIDKAYTQRAKDLDKMGLAMNDQFMTSGERLEMHRKLAEEGQQEKDKMQSQWLLSAKQQYSTDQYNYVMQSINADEATKRDLLYGELSGVMMKYNVQQEDLLNFRKIAADAGLYLTATGLNMA